MNKYALFGLLVLFIGLTTFITDSVISYNELLEFSASNPEAINEAEGFKGINVFSMLGTWWDIISFNVEGMPAIVNLVIFYPLNAIAGYMVVDILKDLVPLT
jgi:hypothetical protein